MPLIRLLITFTFVFSGLNLAQAGKKRKFYYCELSFELKNKKNGKVLQRTERTRTFKRRKFNKRKCARKLRRMIAKNLPTRHASYIVGAAGGTLAGIINKPEASSTISKASSGTSAMLHQMAKQQAAVIVQENFADLKLCRMETRESECDYIE